MRRVGFIAVVMVVFGACSSRAPAPQILTGQLALAGFPGTVTGVRVLQASQVVVAAPIGATGSFAVAVPAGQAYRLEFVYATGQAGLVAPHQSGVIGAKFDVRGGRAPFDLGMVRYIGDPHTQTYSYRSLPPADQGGGAGEQCEDGIDPTTGAVCVDDNSQDGEMCQAGDGDNVDCQDGIDPKTGAFCDGGPAANPTGGGDSAGDAVADGDNVQCENGVDPATGAACVDDDAEDVPAEAAVADHNLPATLGCGDQEGDTEGGDSESD
ncbi:MAG TPA: hypothetical protein VGQ83_13565 [Polyangia bacterium]